MLGKIQKHLRIKAKKGEDSPNRMSDMLRQAEGNRLRKRLKKGQEQQINDRHPKARERADNALGNLNKSIESMSAIASGGGW
jgi:non-homologous end joining protein Ku